MLRILGCGAVVWVLSAVGAARPVFAQVKNAGCDGAVVVKAGRSGPCTKLARTIAGLLEGPEVSRDLENDLKSANPSARAAAVAELPQVGGEQAYHHITTAFDDQSIEVRSSAARALFDLQDDRAAAFTRALREASPERRRAIGAAIASSGLANEAIRNLTGESRDKTYDAFSLLFLMEAIYQITSQSPAEAGSMQ